MPAVFIVHIRPINKTGGTDTFRWKHLPIWSRPLAQQNLSIYIAYMLLRSGLDELEKLPGFLGDAGADQTVVSSLSFVVNPAMESESNLSAGEKEYSELKQRLIQIGNESANKGAEVHFHIFSPVQNQFSCSENIPRAVVVGSDGRRSFCVMK